MHTATSDDSAKDRPKAPTGKKARRKVAKVMSEYKSGDLRSSSGAPVNSRAQAVAIALSEGRRAAKGKS